jgi:hypothetical protein
MFWARGLDPQLPLLSTYTICLDSVLNLAESLIQVDIFWISRSMNESIRWKWIYIVWMSSPIPQFWSCEIAKWNYQLSHLPASQHEWLAVSRLPRYKQWDYHRIARFSESNKVSSSSRYNWSIRNTCSVQSFWQTCLKSEHIRPSKKTWRVFRLPEQKWIKSWQSVHPSPCCFLQCSVTLSRDNAVERNIILSKINSRTGNENPREENAGMKTWEKKMQAWKPESGKCRHDCLRDSEKQILEDKQVVQLRLHLRLLLHTSEK